MADARTLQRLLSPPIKQGWLRMLSTVALIAVVAFFAVSAFHHITQYFELAATDLSVARNRLDAQASLGMVDAVYDVLLHDRISALGIIDLKDTTDITILELRISLAIGVLNALLALGMIFLRRRKALVLFVSALWVLVMTTGLVLASPALMGNVHGEVACNCTGLDILDFSNIWAELARNGAMMIALLWMALAWTPAKRVEHE